MFQWPEWVQGLIPDVKSIVGTIIGAAAGVVIKWFFDRRLIKKLERLVDEARSDRIAALKGREDAIRDRELVLRQHGEREAENRENERKLKEFEQIVQGRAIDVEAQRTKLDNLLMTLRRGNETGLWMTHPKIPPFADFDVRVGRHQPIVITIANHKGGVAKSTLSGNLLAYFDRKLRKRVLAIDLDYQGSLSTMLRSDQAAAIQERKSYVNELLEPKATLSNLLGAMRPLGERLPLSEIVPAFYELALLEDRLLVEWLLQEGGDDVRYRLASILLQDGLKDRYDIVIIDVPPRMTTGTINALCSSTHVLVPAIFNPLAAEPVENFLRTSRALMNHLNPKLEFLGVVETMSPRANEGQDTRAEGRRVISEALKRFGPGIGILDSNVPRRPALAEGVAYLKGGKDGRDARLTFDALGDEIKGRIGL